MSLLWRNLGKPVRKRKSRKRTSGNVRKRTSGNSHKRTSGYSPKIQPYPTVTVTVEVIVQTEKALRIKNERGETTWIPKYWVIKKTELSEHTWEIEIERQNWKDKFPGKPKERLSPRSNHSKGKQKVDPTPIPTVTATVEIVRQTEKAILIKNDRGETAWIPKYWVIKKTELSEHTWQIEIKKQQWEEKFSGKPKERLSPRSRHQKSKG